MRKLVPYALFLGLLLIGGLTAGSILSRGATATSPLSSATVGVLAHPAQATDVLPSSVLELPSARQYDLQGVRLSQEVDGRKLFVVPSKDGLLCLVVSSAAESMSNCGAPKLLENSALYLEQPSDNGTMHVWGVVGDEVTTVEGARVIDNTFAYQGEATPQLHISSGSESRVLDLGSLDPPTP